MDSSSGAEWREKHVETAPFHNNKQILQFITQTEVRFTFIPFYCQLMGKIYKNLKKIKNEAESEKLHVFQ